MAGGWLLIAAAVAFCGGALGQTSGGDAADKRALEAVCGACHSASLVEGLRSEPEWTETVEQMVKLGAKGSDEQFDRLIRFLLRNLTKVNVNTGTASRIAPVLDISEAVAEAVVKRRTE
ncbi:MAG: helix-hairpin-helix domain-containing protein, partial [Acidobacteriia bacterium]|nr:helix-hairpin-helix domain-containing protein [Terriglobia bacterium]